jgi:hypothetical protein
MKLEKEHITLIENHLRNTCWLENQDFIDEMTDHYACALEEKLGEGKAWKEAMNEIDRSLGGRSKLMKTEQKFIQSQHHLGLKYYGNLFKNYFVKFPNCLLAVFAFSIFYVLLTDFAVNPKDLIKITGWVLQSCGFVVIIIALGFYNKIAKISGIGKEKTVVWTFNVIAFNTITQVHYLVNPILENLPNPFVFLSILGTVMVVCGTVALQVLFVILRKTFRKVKVA